jgi:hypothetical protein
VLERAWADYVTAHEQIRKLDGGGSWEQAVRQATTRDAQGSTATFTAFDDQVTQQRDGASKAAVAELGALGSGSTVWAVVIAIVSLIASWLIVRGIGQRLEEYR